MNTSRVPFQSARGLAHSKTWRTSQRSRRTRCVLDCGSPLPLFPAPSWEGIGAAEAKDKAETKQP